MGCVRQTPDRPGDGGGGKMVTAEPFYRIIILQKIKIKIREAQRLTFPLDVVEGGCIIIILDKASEEECRGL